MNLYRHIRRVILGDLIPPLLGLSTGFLDFIPGLILASSRWLFNNFTWLLLIYPQILSIRGATWGIYSGRLTTGLHLGSFKPSLRDNTREFYTMLFSLSVLKMFNCFIIITLGSSILIFLFKSPISILIDVTFVVLSTYAISQILYFIVFEIAKYAYLKGWDPDMLTYPFASTIGDIIVTIAFITVSIVFLYYRAVIILYLLILTLFGFPVVIYSLGIDKHQFRYQISELLLSAVLTSLIVNITGYILRSMHETLIRYPSIYVIYPSILTTVGDIGAIIGSTSTTRLALKGRIFVANTKSFITEIFILSLLIFSIYGILASYLSYGYLNLVVIILTLLSGICAGSIITLISIITAYVTFKRGLDPDNFVNPLESTLADSITTLSLYLFFTIVS